MKWNLAAMLGFFVSKYSKSRGGAV